MQKNWYIIYTKPKCEKKVVALLTKRKIENFCPLNSKQLEKTKKSKLTYEPLFSSYIFVYINENELSLLSNAENVLSILHWRGGPATVTENDIQAIKDFTHDHINIQVLKNRLNSNIEEKNIALSSYKIDGNLLMIKKRSFSKYLPSLGFTLIADIEIDKERDTEISFANVELRLQS